MSGGSTHRRGWAWLAATALVAGLAGCGNGSDEGTSGGSGSGDAPESPAPGSAPADIETGGVEVDAPEGWQAIALPSLGFGVAIPDEWEAVVLSEEGLGSLRQASPMVPGFTESAMAAARSGAVFYAAGIEDPAALANASGEIGADGEPVPVVDLKVRADTDSGVTDVAALEDYARRLASAALPDTELRRVADAPRPIVDIRYRAPISVSGHGDGSSDGDPSPDDDTREEVTVEGTERLVLSGSGVVYSFIITSETAATQDELAPRLLDTVSFPPDEPSD
jgi:hypothetical protein